jgi:RPA family protein
LSDRRREPARWIFSKELRECTKTKLEEEEDSRREYFITPGGAIGRRILICGKITHKSDENDVVKITIADPTGAFYVTFFSKDFNQDTKAQIDLVTENDEVMLMGRTTFFRSAEGKMYVNINPEVVQKIGTEDSEYWKIQSSKYLGRRLQILKEIGKSPKIDEIHLVELGYTKEEVLGCLESKIQYENYNLTSLEEILVSVTSYKVSDNAVKLRDSVLAEIKENNPFGGITYDDLLGKLSKDGITASQLDETLNLLGSDGEIFEAEKRKFRAI